MKRGFPFILLLVSLPVFLSGCNTGEHRGAGYSLDSLIIAQNPMGLVFDSQEISMLRPGLEQNLSLYERLRTLDLSYHVAPALVFSPLPAGYVPEPDRGINNWPIPENVELPENMAGLGFYSIPQLASLLRAGRISSVELTRYFIERLKKYDPCLHCVVSYTEEYALEQARKADEEMAAGRYRGILHGIPYGAKDLFAFRGYPTTWGAGPYRDQVLDETATVIQKLEDAGAVLIAKLSLGALAMGDVWFADTTRNPWNLKQGSSGSSAGSASATAAGLVPFALGTETLGSIVSPSTRCGTTGLRPTFGRISRTGAMALSWSMDKVGPICRNALDCAIVFDIIRGSDGLDQSVIDASFIYPPVADLKKLRVGYLAPAFREKYPGRKNDLASLALFRKLGAKLVPVDLPGDIPVQSLRIILNAEAAAAFDELTRSNRDTLLVRQGRGAWPNTFRQARFIPAVEYIQANRARTILIEQMNRIMREYDLLIAPSFGGNQLLITNLTGHPCVVFPNGFTDEGSPTSITLLGNLFDEAILLAVAELYQANSDMNENHPRMYLE